MDVKRLLAGAALVLLALAAWRYWNAPAVQGLLRPEALRQRVDFDNGSARPPRFDSEPNPGANTPTHSIGAVRKCLKGKQILYTEFDCPPGTREQTIEAGAVNFVPTQDSAKGVPKNTAKTPVTRDCSKVAEGIEQP